MFLTFKNIVAFLEKGHLFSVVSNFLFKVKKQY
jgi:hypothetical protein